MSSQVNASETPLNGQQVFTAAALLHKKLNGSEKIFVAKRANSKKFMPGIFELPGGHVDFGEDLIKGLKRELREELNIDISVGDPFFVFTYSNYIKGSHSIEVIYFARINNPERLKLNPQDHSEYRWIAEDEIDQIREGKDDDPEIEAFKKAFQLLKGGSLNFG